MEAIRARGVTSICGVSAQAIIRNCYFLQIIHFSPSTFSFPVREALECSGDLHKQRRLRPQFSAKHPSFCPLGSSPLVRGASYASANGEKFAMNVPEVYLSNSGVDFTYVRFPRLLMPQR